MLKNLTSEASLEQAIIDGLKAHGYAYIPPQEMKLGYNPKLAIDELRLLDFIRATQPKVYELHKLSTPLGKAKFLNYLDEAIKNHGVIKVLKNGISPYPTGHITLFYHTINPKNPESEMHFQQNIFAATNQLAYSTQNKKLELDVCIFINGLPIITMELKAKSSATGWSYLDAQTQYKNARKNFEPLFAFKRCIAHFALDENNVTFTTQIDGENTTFMPFNKGRDNGAGNPISSGIMTDYLWKEILDKQNLTSLIKDFCYILTYDKNKEKLIFPRYHQWRVVNNLTKDVQTQGVGQKYLIQHSAGSGKSNSITWLAYKLVEMTHQEKPIFDSVLVVTDRINLDRQITNNITQFMDVHSIVARAEKSSKLKEHLENGKKIIITTIQKFPHILDTIGTSLESKTFAIIIDEAHSSQSGKGAASMNMSISGKLNINESDDAEDVLMAYMQAQRMPQNASYFAFTATPKAKTIEMFGKVFDLYAMKQAIEEGFILDVLKNYTFFENYYKIKKNTEDNPLFDVKKGKKKIRKYVEGQPLPLQVKAEEMLNHFLSTTVNKIDGKAKAMVVTDSIERALNYYFKLKSLLKQSGTGYEPLIAFSGEKEYKGKVYTESKINGFSENETPKVFKWDKYKFLIVADKYQTGYDEPLLHTMYVDKELQGVKAVQTLSRLNRTCKGKTDTCVLDFHNAPETIQKSFQLYYAETTLLEETNPNKLYDLLIQLDAKCVYEQAEVEQLVNWVISPKADRQAIEPILNTCVNRYTALSENDQVEFKSGVKAYIRIYNFLASILEIPQPEWAKKKIFFELIVHRIPSLNEDDLSQGILESIGLESYRLEKRNELNLSLENQTGEIKAAHIGVATKKETELATLDYIIESFNEQFPNIEWEDKDKTVRQVNEIPDELNKDENLNNAFSNSDEDNIKLEFAEALKKAMGDIGQNNLDLWHQFFNNDAFREWFSSFVFEQLKKKKSNTNNHPQHSI